MAHGQMSSLKLSCTSESPLGSNNVTAERRARGWQSPIEGLAGGPLCYSHLPARGSLEGRQGSWPPCSGRALGELGEKSEP